MSVAWQHDVNVGPKLMTYNVVSICGNPQNKKSETESKHRNDSSLIYLGKQYCNKGEKRKKKNKAACKIQNLQRAVQRKVPLPVPSVIKSQHWCNAPGGGGGSIYLKHKSWVLRFIYFCSSHNKVSREGDSLL